MSKFFANEDILFDFIDAFEDENTNFSSYNITKSKLNTFLNSKKPTIALAEDFLIFYNEYYFGNKTSDYYYFDEVFDERYLKWYEPEWRTEVSESFLDKFWTTYTYWRFNRSWEVDCDNRKEVLLNENDTFRKIFFDISSKNNTFIQDDNDILIDSVNELYLRDMDDLLSD